MPPSVSQRANAFGSRCKGHGWGTGRVAEEYDCVLQVWGHSDDGVSYCDQAGFRQGRVSDATNGRQRVSNDNNDDGPR